MTTKLLEDVCKQLNWRSNRGDTRGHFRGKPEGHKFISSCKWLVRTRKPGEKYMINPVDLYVLEEMNIAALRCELEDISHWEVNKHRREQLTRKKEADYLLKLVDEWHRPMNRIRNYLHRVRENYPEYACNWDPLTQGDLNFRPGWE